jgi:hypothetical protein
MNRWGGAPSEIVLGKDCAEGRNSWVGHDGGTGFNLPTADALPRPRPDYVIRKFSRTFLLYLRFSSL